MTKWIIYKANHLVTIRVAVPSPIQLYRNVARVLLLWSYKARLHLLSSSFKYQLVLWVGISSKRKTRNLLPNTQNYKHLVIYCFFVPQFYRSRDIHNSRLILASRCTNRLWISSRKGDLFFNLISVADVCQDCTLFGCISYLGSAAINAPKSKTEILRNMAILNEQSSDHAIKVSLSIPNFADGVVVYVYNKIFW